MSAVNEWVVREYLETQGFLVCQPRKYVAMGRQRKAEEEFDFLAVNPSADVHRVPEQIMLDTLALRGITRAIVGVRGWHSERFSTATFAKEPEILRFADEDSLQAATRRLGPGPIARILCLPGLPASGDLKKNTIALLRSRGIDGILSFPTMLSELIATVDAKVNYEKSDLLQILRMLKSYDLLRDDGQMEFFTRRKRATPPAASAPVAEA
jgi:hypothetical protein